MVLITGGSGFLGANLADRIAASGERILIYDNLSRPGVVQNLEWLQHRHTHRIETAIADVRDEGALREAVRQASAVFHLAAQVAVTSSVDDPVTDFEINARGTLNVLEAARRRPDPPPLLFASTNKVYGEAFDPAKLVERERRYEPSLGEPTAIDESWPLKLCSPYGCSKGAADQYVLDYASVYRLRTVVFRMSCLYGPRQFGTEDQGWVAHFLIRALQGRPITIFGDGKQVRDLLYVDDAVEAYVRARARIARARRPSVQPRRRAGQYGQPARDPCLPVRARHRAAADPVCRLAAGRSAVLRLRHVEVRAVHRLARTDLGRGRPAQSAALAARQPQRRW